MKWRKRPVVIDAVQFKGFNGENGHSDFSEKPDWLVNEFGKRILFFQKQNTLTIKTLEGEHVASIGDYIIRGIAGEIYPCKPDIFLRTYEKAE